MGYPVLQTCYFYLFSFLTQSSVIYGFFFSQRRNLGLALYVHMNVQADPKPLYIPMLTLKSCFFFFRSYNQEENQEKKEILSL